MQVFTVIADIIKSREIDSRAGFQQNLKKRLSEISSRSPSILSPYTITLGDEFQAVYQNSSGILEDLLDIILTIHPVRLRVAVGVGELHTDINRDSSIGMDGPAFHYAREGVENMKSSDKTIIQFYEGQSDADLDLINSSLDLVFSELSRWKLNTLFTFKELLNHIPVNEIYPGLGISQRAVYKLISTNNLEKYLHYIEALNTKLKERYPL